MWACLGLVLCLVLPGALGQSGCLYEGRTYSQGQTWSKPCQFNCVCDDASTGHYTCTNVCPTYDNLPPQCRLVKPPGEPCCAKPQCSFATLPPSGSSGSGGGQVITGGGTGPNTGGAGTGVVLTAAPGIITGGGVQTAAPVVITGTGTATGTQGGGFTGMCTGDKIPNCSGYGMGACTQYQAWAAENCCQFCRTGSSGSATGGISTGGGGTGVITGTGVCSGDRISNCADYGRDVCTNPVYQAWANDNCCVYCRSGSSGTVPATASPVGTVTGTCRGDRMQNCADYGRAVCTDPQYQAWVQDNCCQFCQSGGSGMAPATSAPIIMDLLGTGTGSGTGTSACRGNRIQNCADYGRGVCSDAQYQAWVQDNCCQFCQS